MSIHIVEELPNANPMAVTVSVIAIIIMVLNNELLKVNKLLIVNLQFYTR